MKNIKYLLIVVALVSFNIASAVWTAPTATPPGNNTQPPINIGADNQNKSGKIGAKAFCLPGTGAYDSCTTGSNWATFISGIIGGTVTGSGANGYLTQWGTDNALTDSGVLVSDLLTKVGYWTKTGSAIHPTTATDIINNGNFGLKVQVVSADLSNPEVGQIWLVK
ncbi:MAG: hypothetical protein WCO84_04850 [bacterium]